MDGRTDGNASKTVYPPVSICSLGGYKNEKNVISQQPLTDFDDLYVM